MIVDETAVLDREDRYARAEEIILAGLGKCKTWADLARLVQRAGSGRPGRRAQAPRTSRAGARPIQFWREQAGPAPCAALACPRMRPSPRRPTSRPGPRIQGGTDQAADGILRSWPISTHQRRTGPAARGVGQAETKHASPTTSGPRPSGRARRRSPRGHPQGTGQGPRAGAPPQRHDPAALRPRNTASSSHPGPTGPDEDSGGDTGRTT